MSGDKWNEYRVEIQENITRFTVRDNILQCALNYIKGQLDVDQLDILLDFKRTAVEQWQDRFSWIDLKELDTENFACFVIAVYCYCQISGTFKFGEEPYPVVLRQNKDIMQEISDYAILSSWSEMNDFTQREDMEKLRGDFRPSGTQRLDSTEYAFYIVASEYLARAMNQLTYVDDILRGIA